jgi:hypothetical protein
VEDSDHDGMGFWYSSQVEGETSAQFRVRLVGGSYVEIFPADFGHYHRYNFSVGFSVGLEEEDLSHEIAIFPNPTNGQCTIEVSGAVDGEADLFIYDLMGRPVHSEKMICTSNFAEAHPNLSHILPGQYIVKIVSKGSVYTKELMKQ